MFMDAEHPIQLVISDATMPLLRGPELLGLVRKMSPSTASLLISATPTLDIGSANRFILKPFSGQTLVSEVQSLLADCDPEKIKQEQATLRRHARSQVKTILPIASE
jgi:response regulator RpfG family c-di-GMP phosphodiesterase